MLKSMLLAGAALLVGAATASAADLPVRGAAPAPVMASASSWAGFYAGVNAGFGIGSTRVVDNDEWWVYGAAQYDQFGAIGGIQAGYNFQHGNAVFGIEADFSGTTLKGDVSDVDWDSRIQTKTPWFGTLRGRAGVAVSNALLYTTAGFAFIQMNNEACYISDCSSDNYLTKQNRVAVGLAVGAGVEYALGSNWSVKGEHLYMYAPEKKTPNTDGWQTSQNISWQSSYNVVRVGLNYRFGAR
jgi:outer membrane immunogenic protein